jgi:hypothetical protein
MAVTAPETAARQRLRTVIETEFAPEGFDVLNDKLNDSLGQEAPLGGIYPTSSAENPRNGYVLDTILNVQLFQQWDNRIDATQVVDPANIEEWAERLRRACAADLAVPGNDHMWYFRVQKVDFPDDPSGNKSRLVAVILVESTNSALVETSE